MIDHIALYVTDIDRSRRSYEQALAPLGYRVAMEMESFVAFGPPDELRFALRTGKDASTTAHFAFTAEDRPTVDAFHAAALAVGGNGMPFCLPYRLKCELANRANATRCIGGCAPSRSASRARTLRSTAARVLATPSPTTLPGYENRRRNARFGPGYARSVATSGTGSRCGIRRTVRVHFGIHQFASPSSRISAGTSSARMTVASKMIPAARPIANSLIS